jgi:hypothetical protein
LDANFTMLGTPIDLHARNPHLKYYNETLYFAGQLPIWNEKFTHISAVSEARADVMGTKMGTNKCGALFF